MHLIIRAPADFCIDVHLSVFNSIKCSKVVVLLDAIDVIESSLNRSFAALLLLHATATSNSATSLFQCGLGRLRSTRGNSKNKRLEFDWALENLS